MWFGGSTIHDRLLRRLVEYGHGFNPLGQPTPEELQRLDAAMRAAGRDPADLEWVGGIRGRFAGRRRHRRRRPGAGGDSGAGRTRLPLDLLQAVDVHERPRRRRPPVPPRRRAGERAGGVGSHGGCRHPRVPEGPEERPGREPGAITARQHDRGAPSPASSTASPWQRPRRDLVLLLGRRAGRPRPRGRRASEPRRRSADERRQLVPPGDPRVIFAGPVLAALWAARVVRRRFRRRLVERLGTPPLRDASRPVGTGTASRGSRRC